MPYIAAIILLLLPSSNTQAAESSDHQQTPLIIIASVVDNPLTPVAIQFMQQAYTMAGYQTRITSLSAARSQQLLKAGDIDAELFRAEGLDDIPAEMIKVPEALIETKIAAYTINPEVARSPSSALERYRVGIRHGLGIHKRLKTRRISEVYRLEQLVNMLKHDRIDIVILSESSAFFLRRKFGLTELKPLQPALATLPVYHYVHHRHKHLIEILAANIKTLKDKGVPEKMIREFMQQAAQSQSPQ